VSDLCTLAFLGVSVYAYFARGAVTAILLVTQWMPMVLFPLMIAQALSSQGRVDVSTFFWSLRGREAEAGPRRAVDICYPYLVACVLAASAANVQGPEYYAACVVFAAWGLWRARPEGGSAPAFAALFCAAVLAGYSGHVGLSVLQKLTEKTATDLFFGVMIPQTKDPYATTTAIGTIGSLKQSGRILLRVRPAPGQPAPSLLRNAAYDLYRAGRWVARDARFDPARTDGTGSWNLGQASGHELGVEVSMPLSEGCGLLALPSGAYRLERLPAAAVSRSRFGAVKVEYGPSPATYRVRYSAKDSLDGPPGPADLEVPKGYQALLAKLGSDLKLRSVPPPEAVRAVAGFFRDGFRYSLFQRAQGADGDPLENFLLRTRAGHCEYFATAATLLLRGAGIPARYVTGFAVFELSRLEGAYVVRQRHAHAWVRVHVDGAWTDLDVTPPDWTEAEDRRASAWQPLTDLGAWLKHRFARWSAEGGLRGSRGVWAGLAALALAFLGWRFRRGLEADRLRVGRQASAPPPPAPGADSDFYRIETALREAGFERRDWETMAGWLKRTGELPGRPVDVAPLRRLLALHDRYRFDPEGLGPDERRALRGGVEEWLSARSGSRAS